MSKSIEIDVKLKSDEARKGFDGLETSAKDLQERIADLDTSMKTLLETQGKNAYSSQQGLMIQRERGLALEELLNLQDQEIEKTKLSTRGLGSLVSSLFQSTAGVGGFSREISILTTALAGGVGVTAALAMAAGAVKVISDQLNSGGIDVNEYTKKIEELKDEAEKFADATDRVNSTLRKLTDQQIISRIQVLKEELSSLWTLGLYGMGIGRQSFAEMQLMLQQLTGEQTRRSEGGGQSFAERIKGQIDVYTKLRDEVAQTKEEYKRYDDIIKMLNQDLQNKDEKINKVKASTSAYTGEVKKLLEEMLNVMASNEFRIDNPPHPGAKYRNMVKPVREFKKPEIQFSESEKQMFRERERLENEFAMRTASVFTSNMTQAWTDIFGEANSMFEQLMQSWAQMLFQQIGSSLIGSLMGGLGIGDIFGFSRAIDGGAATAAKYRVGG